MRVRRSVVLPTTREEAWSFCSPIGTLIEVLGGIVTLEDSPASAETVAGLQVRLVWSLGATVAGGKVEVVTCVPGHEVEWVSVTGVHHRVRVSLHEVDPQSTRLDVSVTYAASGPLGWVANAVVAPRLGRALDAGLADVALRAGGAKR